MIVLPDWIINLLIKLHLKTSEEQHIRQRIADTEKKIESVQQQADKIVAEIKNIEAQYRESKVEYDALSGIAKETIGVRLTNLLRQRARYSEQNTLLDKQLNAEALILQNLKIQLEHLLRDRETDDIIGLTLDKELEIKEQSERDKQTQKLENTTYTASFTKMEEAAHKHVDFDAPVKDFICQKI